MPRITPLPADLRIKIFERAGSVCVRTAGDHVVLVKQDVLRPIVIPNWKEVSVFFIRNNLRTAGLNREKYFELLKDI